MSCRTEEKRVGLCSERLVLDINCDSIGSLVLESEGNVVFNTIFCLIFFLYGCIYFFKELLMLRRYGNHEISCSIFVLHIVLSLNKMLCKCSADLSICIFMEFENTLWFRSVTQTLVCECLGKNRLTVLRAFTNIFTEQFRSIECKRLDLIYKLCCRSVIRKFLSCIQCIKSAEKILEHT